jgi:hypothetical protein
MDEERWGVEERSAVEGKELRWLGREIAKFSLCFAVYRQHERELESGGGVCGAVKLTLAGLKDLLREEAPAAGIVVEMEGVLSPFSAVYTPRAFYPPYIQGEIRRAMQGCGDFPRVPLHFRPVNRLPASEEIGRLVFLYPPGRRDFERPDFPVDTRDVLTRDFLRFPLLLPPGWDPEPGRVRLRAKVVQVEREILEKCLPMGEKTYLAYLRRGLVHYLFPLDMERTAEPPPATGTLFAELSLEGGKRPGAWLEEVLCPAVEAVFPGRDRGEKKEEGWCLPGAGFHVAGFRGRFASLVYEPAYFLFRAPSSLGVYLPWDLHRDLAEGESRLRSLVEEVIAGLGGEGKAAEPRLRFTFDNTLTWARERGALGGDEFRALIRFHPPLAPVVSWLRGD